MVENLFTPWRYSYITTQSPAETADACFFCAAAAGPDEADRLVVHVARHHLVMLNRHPYTNGHLMVAPLRHCGEPGADLDEAAELWPLVLRSQAILSRAFSPDGFNLGMNLGRAGGAGVPGHCHFHVVPRWAGDTNFMSVVGGVRLVPEDLEATRQRLRRMFQEEP